MRVHITPNDKRGLGKLADAELHFTACPSCTAGGIHSEPACTCGPLVGLKLIGFGIWERRGGSGRNVTFPARSYSVNGERRSFALLRPIDPCGSHEHVKTLILDAFAAFEASAAVEG